MIEHLLINRLKEIYSKLCMKYGDKCNDENWMNEINCWAEIEKEDQQVPDYYFLLNLCYGPWNEQRQKEVWQNVYKNFKEKCEGNLLKATEGSIKLGFPFKWQEKRVKNLAN